MEKTIADEMNIEQLKRIEEEIIATRLKSDELEKEHLKLDAIIEKSKGRKVNDKFEIDKDTEETEVYCVTCGHSCGHSNALKHMEKCFNKVFFKYSISFHFTFSNFTKRRANR